MVLNRQVTKALIRWKPVSDRITPCFHSPQVKTTIVQVYAPTEDANDDVKDAFYDQLQHTVKDTLSHDVKLLMGDFNADRRQSSRLRTCDWTSRHGAADKMIMENGCFCSATSLVCVSATPISIINIYTKDLVLTIWKYL